MRRVLRALAPGAVVLGAVALVGCTPPGGAEGPSGDIALPASQTGPLIDALDEHSAKTPDLSRLGAGLTPPTNAWFSGLVFGSEPMPVFPLPLSFGLTDDGMSFGLPRVTSQPGFISGAFAPDIALDLGADTSRVTEYDEVSVTLTHYSGETELGSTTIARGSPVVSFVAARALSIGLGADFTRDEPSTATIGGTEYGLTTDGSLLADRELSLSTGQRAAWFAVPDGGDAAALAARAASAITGVTTSYWSDSSPVTLLEYGTADGGLALVGALPVQHEGLIAPDSCDLGTFHTVYGDMALCETNALKWTVPAIEPNASLDLAALDGGQKSEILDQLVADVASAADLPADTYFGGKALARMATQLQLARDLGDDALAESLETSLGEELRRWTETGPCVDHCFTYDPVIRGIVGQPSSFGSDEFNDHHFHYGYFLYAAGILAADNPQLVEDLSPVMTLLAADIASGEPSGSFPVRRTFDPYSGHSWASGYSPFADGNNQESSSEAVAAWNGLALWARAAGDDALQSQARWMLSAEAASAKAYYTDFPENSAPYEGYDRSVVGILWDGKRDYATWFSPEPAAIAGIQLIPMGPVSSYLAGDPDRIRQTVAEAMPDGSAPQFADMLLMYQALAGPDDAAAALESARELPDSAIDDGNSRAYLLAWIMAHLG